MAQKTVVTLVDDLDGTELDEGKTVQFAVEDVVYVMDLSFDNAAAFEELMRPYMRAARKVGRITPEALAISFGGRKRRDKTGGLDREQREHLRAWAAENGVEVPSRGRIPAHVIEAYQAAKAEVA